MANTSSTMRYHEANLVKEESKLNNNYIYKAKTVKNSKLYGFR